MKKKKLVALLLALCCTTTVGALTACNKNNDDPNTNIEQTEFTVSFDSKGGTSVADQGVFGNGKITDPGAPTKYGYDFIGWYKNDACTEKWNFETDTVKGHMTLYALWQIKDATADTYFDFTALDGGTMAIAVKTGQTLPADVILPSVYDEKAVTAIKDGAFEGQAAVKSVLIPDSVKSIGSRAFRNCTNLEQVLGAENVEAIGGTAFGGTKYDSNLTGGEVYIGKCLYKYAGGMYTDTEIEVTAGTLGIAASAFQDMEKLTAIMLPAGLKNIGNYAFGGSTKGAGFTAVVIPDSVESIGDNAFRNAKSLATVTIGKGVKTIGANAFAGTAITNLTYNAANATVESNSFAEVTADSTIVFGNEVTAIPVSVTSKFTNLTAVTIGAEITEIPESAFDGKAKLATVTVNGTLTSIGAFAFRGTAITEFTVNKEVTAIGGSAFANCASLTTVNYNAVNATGAPSTSLAFAVCSKLKTVTVGGEVTHIPAYLFKNCAALDTLAIGANVTNIGTEAFYGTAIAEVTIPAKVATIGANVFGNCAALNSVTYNATNATYEGTTTIFAAAATVTVGGGVTNIPAYFVKGNTAITTITLPTGVNVGDYAFQNCTALATITGYDTVGTVGAQAFDGSKYYEDNLSDGLIIQGSTVTGYRGEMPANFVLNAAAIPTGKTVTAIAAEAFKNKTNLTSVELPATVVKVGANAFEGSGLTGTVDLSNVTEIGEAAFKGLTGVTAITLGQSLSKIGASAFEGCTQATMTLKANSLTELGESAFYNCKNLTSIEVNGVAEIPTACFGGTGITSVKLGATVETVGNSWASLSSVTEFTAPNLKHVGNYGLSDLKVTTYSVENIVTFGVGALQGYAAPEVVFGANCETLGEDLFTKVVQVGMAPATVTPTTTLTKVTFNGSKVTKIPNNAFRECANLKTVELCDSITEVGNYAFNSAGITSFDFTHITKLGDYAFCASSLTGELDLGAVTAVPTYCFENCTKITKVTVNASTKTIGSTAFRNSTVKELVMEEGLQTVDAAAFMDTKLEEVTLPSTVKSIGTMAFSTSTLKKVLLNSYIAIENVSLGAANADSSTNSFKSSVFFVCASDEVKAQYIAETSAWKTAAGDNWSTVWASQFLTEDEMSSDWVIDENGVLVSYTGDKVNIKIPASLKTIDFSKMFTDSERDLVQSYTVAEGNTAFNVIDGALCSYDGKIIYDFPCASVQRVYTNMQAETVGEKAFMNATNLESANVPNVKVIKVSGFSNSGLKSIELEKIVTIEALAFMNCKKLSVITIGSSCEKIYNMAFGMQTGSQTDNGEFTVTIRATNPPTLLMMGFPSLASINGKIYVPSESVEAYKAANTWSGYADYIEAIPDETPAPDPAPANLEALLADNKNNG